MINLSHPCGHRLFALHTLCRFLGLSDWFYTVFRSHGQTPRQKLASICQLGKFEVSIILTMLFLVLKRATGGKTDWHYLCVSHCLWEEWSVELDESNIVVTAVQLFWFISFVNNNLFNPPVNSK